MQLVVVMAVRKAVAAATITFTAISIKRFFIIVNYQLSIINYQLSIINCQFQRVAPKGALLVLSGVVVVVALGELLGGNLT